MKIFQNSHSIRVFSLLLLIVVVWNCSAPASLDDGVLTVVNRTSQPLIFKVLELESSHLIDPILSFPLDQNKMALIQPKESLSISNDEIYGDYSSGKDIRFFIYTIRSDSAFYSNSSTLTKEELERNEFRVEIEEGAEGFLVTGFVRE